MPSLRTWLIGGFFCVIAFPVNLVGAPTVELLIGERAYRGLNVAHDRNICWLASADGSYERIKVSEVTKFRKVNSEFRSLTSTAMAAEVRNLMGRKFDVQTRGQFVICAPTGQAGQYADLLSRVEKSFHGYFSRRGWALANSGFPLVMVVLPDKQEFDKACLQAGTQPSANLRGFYHPQTNQVTLYDQSAGAGGNKSGKLDPMSVSVALHEVIHQLAFNSGLHQRIGENPRWVVEGLATMLEAGALDSTVRSDSAGRVNQERLQRFREFRAKRRTGTLIDFISNGDELYLSNPLDFYSEAWALTFYLAEAKRPDYVRYLKRISDRDPLQGDYSPQERLADMQAIFGKDLRWLETKFLRFIDDLE